MQARRSDTHLVSIRFDVTGSGMTKLSLDDDRPGLTGLGVQCRVKKQAEGKGSLPRSAYGQQPARCMFRGLFHGLDTYAAAPRPGSSSCGWDLVGREHYFR